MHTEPKGSLSKRFRFYTAIRSLFQFEEVDRVAQRELATIHFLVLCMILAIEDPIDLDCDIPQTVKNLAAKIVTATSFEVG